MMCPECAVEMEEYGYMKECPVCHCSMCFGHSFAIAEDMTL